MLDRHSEGMKFSAINEFFEFKQIFTKTGVVTKTPT